MSSPFQITIYLVCITQNSLGRGNDKVYMKLNVMIPISMIGDNFIVFDPCACTKMQRDIPVLRCTCMTLRQAEDSPSSQANGTTVVPTKSDSDVMLCLQLLI